MDTPQVLLEHYLKQLHLPTMAREYRKLGEQCAKEGVTFEVSSNNAATPSRAAIRHASVNLESLRTRHSRMGARRDNGLAVYAIGDKLSRTL